MLLAVMSGVLVFIGKKAMGTMRTHTFPAGLKMRVARERGEDQQIDMISGKNLLPGDMNSGIDAIPVSGAPHHPRGDTRGVSMTRSLCNGNASHLWN